MAETDQIDITRTIHITISCRNSNKYLVAPLMVYYGYRLSLLKELIHSGTCPKILDKKLAPKNDNAIQHYTWDDIEKIHFGKTEHNCRFYLGPNTIYLIPQNIEMIRGQCMALI